MESADQPLHRRHLGCPWRLAWRPQRCGERQCASSAKLLCAGASVSLRAHDSPFYHRLSCLCQRSHCAAVFETAFSDGFRRQL